MNWYFEGWKKYAVFGGRAGRQEYWYFVLFNVLAFFLSTIVAAAISAKVGGALLVIYALASMIPTLAVSVRRLHDTNRSGLWFLVILVPTIGHIVFMILMALDSEEGENQYDPSGSFPGVTYRQLAPPAASPLGFAAAELHLERSNLCRS